MDYDQQLPNEHFVVTVTNPPPAVREDHKILHPVTINQVLQASDHLTVGSVALVAYVKSVDIGAATATFILEDGTGKIYGDVELFALIHHGGESTEAEEEERSQYWTLKHAYVEVIATLKKQNNTQWQPRLKISSIHQVQGYHQVMYHILHVINSGILSEQSLQSLGSSGVMEEAVYDGQAQDDQNCTTVQHHITCEIPASPPILPNSFSPQKHQPYAALKPLERVIIKHIQKNQPVWIAELAQAITLLSECTESQFNLAVQSLLSEAYITSPLDDGYVVITPRH